MAIDPCILRAAGAAADEEPSQEPVGVAKESCPVPWLEVKVVSDRQTPCARERVQLYIGSKILDEQITVTDDRGVARWDRLPADKTVFHVQLIDVLEAWPPLRGPASSISSDAIPKPEGFSKGDTTAHKVDTCVVADEQVVVVNRLTVPEKLSHFVHAYVDNHAVWSNAKPSFFLGSPPRWRWGVGSVCNQHVNFFLGYWFNFNEQFTANGSATMMAALPTFTSEKQIVWKTTKHRGYKEFLAPITGGDLTYHHASLDRDLEYFWIGHYFDKTTGAPRGDLFDKLGEINVYSLSDASPKKTGAALAAVRGFLTEHPERLPDASPARGVGSGKPSKRSVKSLTDAELWAIAWDLDRADPSSAALRSRLMGMLNYDHHAGIIYKRDGLLWTFSADGGPKNHADIIEKPFTAQFYRKALCMAFWRLHPLRPGGYSPLLSENNAGGISVNNLSRFIQWVR